MNKVDPKVWAEQLIEGNTIALSRAITLVESTLDKHAEAAAQLMETIMPHTGKAQRIAVTGVPGVGKSTFIETLGQSFLEEGHRLAILAIDPTSTRSRGSILGDKTRMNTLSHNEDVYVRPSPAGNSLGGVARKTRETLLLCEAAGFNTILVETVGVGQSETLVHGMTDLFLLLMLPGAGDELQGIKRGIMELADILVLHKVEDHNRNLAKQAMRQYKNALHLMPPAPSGWSPSVLSASSYTKEGIDAVFKTIKTYFQEVKRNGFLEKQRAQQSIAAFRQSLQEEVWNMAKAKLSESEWTAIEEQLVQQKVSPIQAAKQINEKLWH